MHAHVHVAELYSGAPAHGAAGCMPRRSAAAVVMPGGGHECGGVGGVWCCVVVCGRGACGGVAALSLQLLSPGARAWASEAVALPSSTTAGMTRPSMASTLCPSLEGHLRRNARWLRPRPAGSPTEAAFSARASLRQPRASASLVQSAARAALAGSIWGPCFPQRGMTRAAACHARGSGRRACGSCSRMRRCASQGWS